MLLKLRHTFFIFLGVIILNSCQTRWAADSFIKAEQNKQQRKKDKADRKKKKEYHKYIEKQKDNNYQRQANSTKETWDKNTEKSEQWRKKEFHDNSFFYRVRKFFEIFKREPKPKTGILSKKQQKKRKKGFIKKIFKKKRGKNNHGR